MSMVVLDGLRSRPGLPCLRAAVDAYLFHCSVMRLFPFHAVQVGWVEPLRDPTRRRHGVAMLGLVNTRPNLQVSRRKTWITATSAAMTIIRTPQDAARPAHRRAAPDAPRRDRRLSPY